MCLEIAKSGNNVMIPNLVHSRVARNGKMCAQELPIMFCFQIWLIPELPGMAKSGNVSNCFQIWLILELPGMAMVCAQEFPKVAIMFFASKSGSFHGFARNDQRWQCICFQIWLFPIPNSGNNVLFPNLALSMELPRMPKIGICFPGVARNGNGVCPRIPKSGNKILQGKKEIN